MTKCEPLPITVFLAAPLDGAPPVRCSTEMSALVQALNDAEISCLLDAIRPPRPELICNTAIKGILHVTCHGSDDGLELQDAAGRSVCYGGTQFAEAIGGSWHLVILNGCDTSTVGEVVNATLGVSVICTSGFVADSAAERFTEIFYRAVSAGRDFSAAADHASGLVGAQWQVAYHYLPGREQAIAISDGVCTLTPRFKAAVQSTLATRTLAPSRRGLLTTLHQGMTGTFRGVSVSGPPGAGVSTLLRAASEYFEWLAPTGPCIVDGRGAARDEELESQLSDPTAWVIVDHFDNAPQTLRERILNALTASPNQRARILVGGQGTLPSGLLSEMPLNPLSSGEAMDWLAAEHGQSKNDWSWILSIMEPWPGRLQSLVPHIVSGASGDEIRDLLLEGNPSSDIKSTIDLLWLNPLLRTALIVICTFPMAPRHLAKRAWMSALQMSDDNADEAQFSDLLLLASRHGLIRFREVITRAGAIVTYVAPDPDAAAVVRRKRVGTLTPAQLSRSREVFLQGLEIAHTSATIDSDADWSWVSALLRACFVAGEGEDRAIKAIYPHLDRGGDMLRFGDAAKQRLIVDSAFDVARHIGAWDEAAQLTLVRGQMRYRTGDLEGAEKEFRKMLRVNPSASRKLQAHRALGQVAYRRADYAEALRCYGRAKKYVDEANAFVVTTLLQESGKALSRLGRGPEAVAILREVLSRRNEAAGVREVAKAEHELARALLRLNELPEARSLFESAHQASLTSGDEKWALGPLYHLFLIELESDDIPAARSRLEELKRDAGRLQEQLWITFAELGTAMLLFAQEHYAASRAVMDGALKKAGAHGYHQVSEDAREWVRKRCMRVMNLVGPDVVSTGLAEVLSLVEDVAVGKASKALRYSARPDLVTSVEVELASDHETRHLRWKNEQGWTCTCPLFAEAGHCSHVLMVLLRGIAPTSQ